MEIVYSSNAVYVCQPRYHRTELVISVRKSSRATVITSQLRVSGR
jgi:hypothetical protein